MLFVPFKTKRGLWFCCSCSLYYCVGVDVCVVVRLVFVFCGVIVFFVLCWFCSVCVFVGCFAMCTFVLCVVSCVGFPCFVCA